MEIIRDLFRLMKERKKWWLLPVLVVLLAVGFLIFFAGGTAVAPFIYTVF